MALTFSQKRSAENPEIIQLNCINPKGDRESLVFTVKIRSAVNPKTGTKEDHLAVMLNNEKKGKLTNPVVLKIESGDGLVQEAKMSDAVVQSGYEQIAAYTVYQDVEGQFFVTSSESPFGLKPHELMVDTIGYAGTTVTADKITSDAIVTYSDIINVLMALLEQGKLTNPHIALALSRVADSEGDTNASLYIWYEKTTNPVFKALYQSEYNAAKKAEADDAQELMDLKAAVAYVQSLTVEEEVMSHV